MGWFGYGIYDGDDTQTQHYNFIKYSKIEEYLDQALEENWLGDKTKIPKNSINKFIKNLDLVIKKMPKTKFWDEYNAISWQMLGALLLDNNIKLPKEVKEKAKQATLFLIEEHAKDFDFPTKRKTKLRNFLKRIKND